MMHAWKHVQLQNSIKGAEYRSIDGAYSSVSPHSLYMKEQSLDVIGIT